MTPEASIGEAIFAFMLTTMSFTPTDKGQIQICVMHPNEQDMSCTLVQQNAFCGITANGEGAITWPETKKRGQMPPSKHNF